MAEDFLLKGRVEVDAKGAVAGIDATKTAISGVAQSQQAGVAATNAAALAQRKLAEAQEAAAKSARAQRAGVQQLGLQFGDFSQQVSLGINPLVAFGQQAGQAAYAASQMGGAVGKVGAFFTGPWGAIILAATTVLGQLAYQFLSNGDEAEKTKDKTRTLADAMKDLNEVAGVTHKSAEQRVQDLKAEAAALLNAEIATRSKTKAELERLLALKADRAGNERTQGVADSRIGQAQIDIAKQDAAIAKRKEEIAVADGLFRSNQTAAAATSVAAAATQAYDRVITRLNASFKARKISEAELTAGLIAAKQAQEAQTAAGDKATAAARTAAKATRDAASAGREAARDAQQLASENAGLVSSYGDVTKAARDYAAAIAGIATAEARGLIGGDEAGRARMRAINGNLDANGIAPRAPVSVADVGEIKTELAGAGTGLGEAAGEAFGNSALSFSDAIGRAIGGSMGSKISGFASLLGADKGGTAASFGTAFKTSFKDLGDKLGSVLPKGLGAAAGKAFAGASQGQFASSIAGAIGIQQSKLGAQIGGALGSFLGPLGGIAGGLIGGTLGGLLKKTQFASATVSGSGGSLSSGAATGNSAGYRKAADALGSSVGDAVQALVNQLGGEIGDFRVSIGQRKGKFVVDGSGSGRVKGGGVQSFGSESEAVQAALADAIRDGAVSGVSPRVAGVLGQYADNVNKAVAEALKVKSLEDLLANRENPFATIFRDFEYQARQRTEAARKYGFDLVEIEKIAAEERAKLIKDSLDRTVSSAKSLLDELRFGSRAEGSFGSRISALTNARDAAAAAVRGGDTSQLDRLSQLSGQLLDLQKEGFGSTAAFSASRQETIGLLDGLVRQTQDRIDAASKAAQAAQDKTAPLLTEANASLDDLVRLGQVQGEQLAALTAAVLSLGGGNGLAAAQRYERNI